MRTQKKTSESLGLPMLKDNVELVIAGSILIPNNFMQWQQYG